MTGLDTLARGIEEIPSLTYEGRVQGVRGLTIELSGPPEIMRVGTRLSVDDGNGGSVAVEVVGFNGDRAVAMTFASLDGVRQGARAHTTVDGAFVRPSRAWLGRVVNGFGEPVDGKGPIRSGAEIYKLRGEPPPAHERARVGAPLDLGVRALNTFTTCCRGQRLGIFAGSGVGKSVLFSMLARNTACDVAIVGLIGERGREVREFISDDLGEEGLEKAVVVVATSDQSALMRRQAAFLTLTLSEYFRDQGDDVLCLMDSVTRFALAQREIGLATGEPPTTRGYTPTVFTELPKLLERAGPGKDCGTITGLFTVLVEGDDHNDPVADAVRAILDGHVVMDRAIAERGRFPAIDVMKSVSRTMPECIKPEYREILKEARQLMGAYGDMEEIIRLGAYRRGSDPIIDRAIDLNPAFEGFLGQTKDEVTGLDDGYSQLAQILSGGHHEVVNE